MNGYKIALLKAILYLNRSTGCKRYALEYATDDKNEIYQ